MNSENSKSSTLDASRRALAVGMIAISCLTGCTEIHEVKVISVKTYEQYEKQSEWIAEFPHMVVESVETRERFKIFGEPTATAGEVFRMRF